MSAVFVVGMIAFCLVLDWVVLQRKQRAEAAEPAPFAFPENAFAAAPGRFYAPGHTWASIREDGDVRVGIDALARRALGRPDSVELPLVGQRVVKGGSAVTFLRDGRRLTFRSPVSGTVVAVNSSPAAAATGNWFFTVEPTRLGFELKTLRIAEEAASWLRREAARFRDFLVEGFRASPEFATLPDGGVPADGVLGLLPEETWSAFEDEFLASDG